MEMYLYLLLFYNYFMIHHFSFQPIMIRIEDAHAQAVCWESEDALVLTNPSTLSLLNMTSQSRCDMN